MSLPDDPDSPETLEKLTRVILAYWQEFHPDLLERDPSDPDDEDPKDLAREKAQWVVQYYRANIVPWGKHQAWATAMRDIAYSL
jgi:hypothetical protein